MELDSKLIHVIAWNKFRMDLKTNTLNPIIRKEYDKRNEDGLRLQKLNEFMNKVLLGETFYEIPEEIRLMLKELAQ